jgi:transcriptional regulator with XRE-family HTH domain
MATMATRALVTNQRVAEDLGVTHSAVSRIRSGDRLPSLALVRRISARYNWSVEEQIEDLDPTRYAAAFEAILAKRYV